MDDPTLLYSLQGPKSQFSLQWPCHHSFSFVVQNPMLVYSRSANHHTIHWHFLQVYVLKAVRWDKCPPSYEDQCGERNDWGFCIHSTLLPHLFLHTISWCIALEIIDETEIWHVVQYHIVNAELLQLTTTYNGRKCFLWITSNRHLLCLPLPRMLLTLPPEIPSSSCCHS